MAMETLTQAESTRLLNVLREMAGDKQPKEARKHKRRPVAMGVWIKIISRGRARHQMARVMLANVSARGVGILSNRPIAVSDRIVLRLPFAEGGGWIVLASVKNSAPAQGKGTFRAGAEFISWCDDPTGHTPIPTEWITSWN
jgi:hypothetical protein